jgi:membrane-associated protein
MDYRTFVKYSAVGAVVWVVTLTAAGMLLGQITVIRENIDIVTLCLIATSLIPVAVEVRRRRR